MTPKPTLAAGLCAAALLLAAAGNAGAAVGNARHGRAVAATHCASCHGARGNARSPSVPKLAGQDAAYLYLESRAFRTGARASVAMKAAVADLPDADLADAAAFYGTQVIRPDPVRDRALTEAGERLFYERPGYGRGPSCAMCHDGGRMPMMGMMGGGMMRARDAPRLHGQHAQYLLRQLDAFASGQRSGTVMNRIAAELDAAQRRALAAYLSVTR